MEGKQIAGYIGAAAAIAFGAALLWVPPPGLAGQAGTVGAAFTFVAGGLAALGVTATVPVVQQQARQAGRREGVAIAEEMRTLGSVRKAGRK